MRIKTILKDYWLLWLIVTAGLVYGAHRIATERVMTLWAFDAGTGAPVWSAEFDGDWRGVDRPQLTPDGAALILRQSSANNLFRIDPRDGAIVWTREISSEFTREHITPYLNNDTIYIISRERESRERVSALEISTGIERWTGLVDYSEGAVASVDGLWLSRRSASDEVLERLDNASGVRATLVLTQPRVGNLYCLLAPCMDSKDGRVFIANFSGPGRVVWTDGNRAPLLFGGRVRGGSLGADAVYVIEANASRVSAYRLTDGAQLWTNTLDGAPRELDIRSVYVTPGGLYTMFESNRGGSNEVWLAALDPITGAERWRQPFGDAFGFATVPPAAGADTVAVLHDEKLHVFRASDGARLWTFAVGPSPDVVVHDAVRNRLIAMGRGERWRRWAGVLGLRPE